MKLTTLLMAMISHTVIAVPFAKVHPQNLLVQGLSFNAPSDTENEKLVEKILDDIIAMQLATDRETIAFSLSETKMEINNKKQSEEILKKFKAKYKIEKGLTIAYARTSNSTALSITNP
jgi:hypothetical protein